MSSSRIDTLSLLHRKSCYSKGDYKFPNYGHLSRFHEDPSLSLKANAAALLGHQSTRKGKGEITRE